MPLREEDIKRKLGKLGSQLGFKCKNEYRLKMPGVDRYIGYVDHVWFLTLSLQALQEVDAQIEIQLPAVSFEITTRLDKLWNPKGNERRHNQPAHPSTCPGSIGHPI